MIIDSHCDTPSMLLRGRNLLAQPSRRLASGQTVTFEKMRSAGVGGSFFALYTSNAFSPEAARKRVDTMLSQLDKAVAACHFAAYASSAADALRNESEGKVSVFLGIENATFCGSDVSAIDPYLDRGVRYVIMTHARDNQFCDSCSGSGTSGGLTPLGKEMVRHLQSRGVYVDVSHLSEKTFYDILDITSAPIIASHSCCKALCSHRRNLTDDQIRRIRDVGGVVQINFCPSFLRDDVSSDAAIADFEDRADALEVALEKAVTELRSRVPEAWNPDYDFSTMPEYVDYYALLARYQALHSLPAISDVADHICHVADLIGPEYVGFGSDFDGIYAAPHGLEDVSGLPALFEELSRRGFSASEIEGFKGNNLLKLL